LIFVGLGNHAGRTKTNTQHFPIVTIEHNSQYAGTLHYRVEVIKEKKLGRKQLQEKLENLPTLYFDSWNELTVECIRLQHQNVNHHIYEDDDEPYYTTALNCIYHASGKQIKTQEEEKSRI